MEVSNIITYLWFMITLTEETIEQIKKDKKLRIAIQSILNISHTTMYKYVNTNDGRLVNINVINMLVKETGKSESQIVSSQTNN